MGKFDPIDGKSYGYCETCGVDIATQSDSEHHQADTIQGGVGSWSHRICIMNGSRLDRVAFEVHDVVNDAVGRVAVKLAELVHGGDASKDEVVWALRWYSDFEEAFNSEVE